ncbi:MAG TPA: hypothetical protein VM537_21655 [Anaerolineae bacterium]|nr:hypothetical protein [Anaerolineae bacterium]
MTWYWHKEGDALVIREEREDDEEGEYVAEIDMRYMTPAERQKAAQTATNIINAHNKAKEDAG